MSQTSYSITADEAIAGMLADPGLDKFLISLANEESSVVEFGLAVVAGTDAEKEFLKPSAAAQNLRGVLVHQQAQEDLSAPGLAATETGNVMRRGRIWVQIDQDVAVGDPVYFRHTGTAADIGKFRMDADTANADQVSEASWLKGGTAAGLGLALLEINLP